MHWVSRMSVSCSTLPTTAMPRSSAYNSNTERQRMSGLPTLSHESLHISTVYSRVSPYPVPEVNVPKPSDDHHNTKWPPVPWVLQVFGMSPVALPSSPVSKPSTDN